MLACLPDAGAVCPAARNCFTRISSLRSAKAHLAQEIALVDELLALVLVSLRIPTILVGYSDLIPVSIAI
jgi:hypothetical protein